MLAGGPLPDGGGSEVKHEPRRQQAIYYDQKISIASIFAGPFTDTN